MDVNQEEQIQNLSDTLSNLQIQWYADVQVLQTEVNSVGADIPLLKDKITLVKNNLHSIKLNLHDISQCLLTFHQQLLHFQHPPPPVPPPHFIDVPIMSHASFSGNPKELNRFLYFIKDQLVEVEAWFLTEKNKINWVVRHFCHINGHMANSALSYNWWILVLKENARVQQLNPQFASAEDLC
ncbi:hypothetical protein PCANC_05367 [Puccinia coronata f. sp. avenae]|uniref:Uncharacterized protein n=1 Tax=Puccinia coronata f. sp. avenae TaxID=200324 RepID=A0A2N5SU63_9BASI|nr:hypothetical protein PCANC_15384 [Puccinia coronata f. sp. avenae]PLW54625.1 hypothetical protein PCANC_05367 [Puccinia coronata f. sp. avenae]